MLRFEEVQSKIAEAAKKYFEIIDESNIIEQLNMSKELRVVVTMPEFKSPYPVTATVSFLYENFEIFDSFMPELFDLYDELSEKTIELNVTINLPFFDGFDFNNVVETYEEIADQYSFLDPVLIKREFYRKEFPSDVEYDIAYGLFASDEDLESSDYYDEIFFDLSNIIKTIYNRNRHLIDNSWYREHDDDTF